MKALYRRYRPMKLDEVVGQPQVIEPLLGALKAGKISHAYLFVGPRGCGKTSVARILAHEINGFKYEAEDDYVDIIEIDGASNRGIDNIRELREKVMIAPTSGKYKVYIIDEVHMLTKEAFNALLKTLEEPPKHAVFILATTDAYKVPTTITSRTQVYTFKLADGKVMHDYLAKVAAEEGIKIDAEALDIIVRRGGGSFRDSLSLLDQISTLSNEQITKDTVARAMGLPADEKLTAIIEGYCKGDANAINQALHELMDSGVKADTLVGELISQIMISPQKETLPLLAKLAEIKPPYAEAKLLVALLYNNSTTTISTVSKTTSLTSVPHPASNIPSVTVSTTENTVSVTQSDASAKLPSEVATPPDSGAFDWQQFVDKVQSLNDAVYTQLIKTKHELRGDELLIYPGRGIVKTILSRENNKRILVSAAGGVKITICDVGDTPSNVKQDETLSKISAIMGGEVRNDGGTSPF